MKKIIFAWFVLCTVLGSCSLMDLSDVGNGDGDRLKSSEVRSLLSGTADGCWKAVCQGHEFYFQFHEDGTVTLDSDFLVEAVESKTSYATSGKAVEMVIDGCDVHLQNLGSAFVDTKFLVSSVPADGEPVKLELVGQTTGNTMELQPTTAAYISTQVAPKSDFTELFAKNLLDNQVITDVSGNLVGYYGLALNSVSDMSVKVLTLEDRSGKDTKGHVRYYESQLTKEGKSFRLDTPVSGIKATNGATYAFTAINCSGETVAVDGMTGVSFTSNKNAVKGFDYTSGKKYSMNKKNNQGNACDEIWEETGSTFNGIPYDEIHPEGLDCMRYSWDGVVSTGVRPLCIWRDWYANIILPGSEEGTDILMNTSDKDWIVFKNVQPSGITHAPYGKTSTPEEIERICGALENLLATWFNEKGLFVARVPNESAYYLLCPDMTATADGGLWMKWVESN